MFDFDVSDKHTVQQAVDADKAEGLLRAKRAGSPDGDVTSALLARMAEAGNGALSTQLAQLKKGDPGLYATAMTALQPLMGNQGVNQLHESVQRQGSGNAIIDFAQAKWAAESVQRRPEGHGEEGREIQASAALLLSQARRPAQRSSYSAAGLPAPLQAELRQLYLPLQRRGGVVQAYSGLNESQRALVQPAISSGRRFLEALPQKPVDWDLLEAELSRFQDPVMIVGQLDLAPNAQEELRKAGANATGASNIIRGARSTLEEVRGLCTSSLEAAFYHLTDAEREADSEAPSQDVLAALKIAKHGIQGVHSDLFDIEKLVELEALGSRIHDYANVLTVAKGGGGNVASLAEQAFQKALVAWELILGRALPQEQVLDSLSIVITRAIGEIEAACQDGEVADDLNQSAQPKLAAAPGVAQTKPGDTGEQGGRLTVSQRAAAIQARYDAEGRRGGSGPVQAASKAEIEAMKPEFKRRCSDAGVNGEKYWKTIVEAVDKGDAGALAGFAKEVSDKLAVPDTAKQALWSGHGRARADALGGFATLENTVIGGILDKLELWEEWGGHGELLWEAVSHEYARRAEGEIHCFLSKLGAIFQQEHKIVAEKAGVTIVYHAVAKTDDGQIVELEADGSVSEGGGSVTLGSLGACEAALEAYKTKKAALGKFRSTAALLKVESERQPQSAEGSDSAGSSAPGEAASTTTTRTGLPGDVQAKMEGAFGQSFSDVTIHTGSHAAEQIGALAFAQGTDVHFAPGEFNPTTESGQALIGHELTHVVQQRAGRVGPPTHTSGGMPINADHRLESEADAMGAKAARGEAAPVSGASRSDQHFKMADSQPKMDAAQRAAGPGTDVNLEVGGIQFKARIPSSAQPGQVDIQLNTDVAGGMVHLANASITFDDSWNIQDGRLNGSIKLPDGIAVGDFQLRIDGSGQVEATLDLHGTVGSFADVALKGQITSGEGVSAELRCTLTKDLTAELGDAKIGVRVESGAEIVGKYQPEDLQAKGSISVIVIGPSGDWAKADLKGDYKHKAGTWSVTGTVKQIADQKFGGVVVSGGELNVDVQDNALKKVDAKVDWTYEDYLKGDAKGSYDAAAKELTAKANVELTNEYALPIAGSKLTSAKGSVEIEKNQLKTIKGEGAAEIAWKGEPTLSVKVEGVQYDVEPKKFNGTGEAKLLRPLKADMGPAKLTLEGGSAQLAVKDNDLETLKLTGLKFSAEATVAGRNLKFDGSLVEGGLSKGDYSFKVSPGSLGDAIKIGQKSVELEQPLNVDVDVQGMSLKRVSVTDATVRVTGIGPDGGEVKGSLTAEIDVGSMEANGSITAQAGGFSVKSGSATYTLSSVSVTGTVEKSQLGTVTLDAQVDVDVTGKVPFALTGKVGGTYEGAKNVITTGKLDVSLKGDATIPAPGGAVVVKDGSKVTASVANNAFAEATVDVKGEYQRDGKAVLAGSIPGAKYQVQAGKLTGTASLQLVDELKHTKGKTTVGLGPGGSVEVEVKDNELESVQVSGIKGTAKSEMKGTAIGATIEANGGWKKADGFSGKAKLTLDPFTWSNGTFTVGLESCEANAEVAANKLDRLTVDTAKFSASASVKGKTVEFSGTLLKAGLSEGEVSFKAEPAELKNAIKIGDKSVELVQPVSFKADVQGSSLKSLTFENVQVKVTGLGTAEDGVVSAKISGHVDVGAWEVSGQLTGGIENGFKVGSGKVTVGLNSGSVKGSVEKNTLAAVEVNNVDIDVTINAKQAIKFGGKLNGSYDGGSKKVTTADFDVGLQGDLTIPAGDDQFVVKDGTKATGKISANNLDEASIKGSVEYHQNGQLGLRGSIDGKYITASGKASGTAQLDVVKLSTTKLGVTAWAEGGTIAVEVKDNALEKVDVSGLSGGIEGSFKGASIKGSLSILSGSYSKADGFSVTAKLNLDKLNWSNGRFTVGLESCQVEVTLTKNKLETLKVPSATFSASAQLASRTFGFSGTLKDGDFSESKVGFDVSPASIQDDFKIGQKSVELTQPMSFNATVRESSLKSLSFENVGLKITGLGKDSNGSVWAKASGTVDVDKMEATGTFDGGVENGFTVGSGKVQVAFNSGTVSGAFDKNTLASVTLTNIDIDVTVTSKQTIILNGKLNGSYDGGSQKVTTAEIDVKVKSNVDIPIGQDKVVIKENSGAGATITNNDLTEVRVDMQAEYWAKGEKFLEGGISNGKYNVPAGEASGSGNLALVGKLQKTIGKTTVTIGPGGSVDVDLQANELNELKLTDIAVKIDTQIAKGPLSLAGKVSGTYTKDQGLVEGSAELHIDGPDVTIQTSKGKVVIGGSASIDGKMAEGELIELGVGRLSLSVTHTVGGQTFTVNGNIDEGRWSKANGITLKAGVSLDPPGYTWTTNKFTISVGGGGAKIDITNDEFQYLEVNNLDLSATGSFGKQQVGANLKINHGKITPDAITLNADGTILGDLKVGPVTVESGSGVGFTVTENNLEEIRFNNVGVRVGDIGTNKAGVVKGFVSGSINVPGASFTGTVIASVESGFEIKSGKVTVNVHTGGMVSGTIGSNILEQAAIMLELDVRVDNKAPIELKGIIGGTYDGSGNTVSGALTLSLLSDLEIPVGGGDKLVVEENSTATATIAANNLDTVTVNAKAQYHHAGELLLAGGVQGAKYDAGAGTVSGDGNLKLKKTVSESTADGKWTLSVKENTSFDVSVSNNALTRVGGNIEFGIQGGDAILAGSLRSCELKVASMKFSGDLDVAVQGSGFTFPRGGGAASPGLSMTVKAGSTAKGHMEDNSLTEASVVLKLDVTYGGAKADGNLSGDWNVTSDKVNAKGDFKLQGDMELAGGGGSGKEIGDWSVSIKDGASVGVDVQGNVLQEASVNFDLKLKKGGEAVASGHVDGSYKFGDPGGYNGSASLKLDKEIQVDQVGRFTVWLKPPTGGSAELAASKVTSANVDFNMVVKDGGKDAIKVNFNADYAPGSGVNGGGGIEVLQDVKIGTGGGYVVYIAAGSGGNLSFVNNKPGPVSGTLTVAVEKDGTKFAEAKLSADYDFSQGDSAKLNAKGSVEIVKSIKIGTAAGYDFTLASGSGLSGEVKDNALLWVEGKLGLKVAEGGKDFFEVDIQGKYVGGGRPDFSGKGSGKFVAEKKLGNYGGYDFVIKPGTTSATISLANSALEWVDGSIELDMRKDKGTINVHLQGKYTKDGNSFTGGGSCDIQDKITISAGEFAFTIEPGSGLKFSVTNNKLDFISGTLKGQVDWGAPFLGINATVTYRNIGPGEIDVEGKVKILGEKQLVAIGDYQFWLVPSQGYTCEVDIKKNDVKKVSAEVSFKIVDDKGTLLVGSANGTWLKSTNKFTGSGSLKLGSDRTFNLPGGGMLVFKAGSGGDAEVKDSELRKLGGTLTVEIHDKDGHLATATASGQYDAVAKKIIKADGGVTVHRTWSVMGGKIIVSNIAGQAKIRDNKLRALEGSADFDMPDWNVKGGFTKLSWSDETGTDVYEGSGWVHIKLLDGKVDGRVTVEQFKYGGGATKFKVKGDVSYKMKEWIKGTVGIEVDEQLDPKLSGSIEVSTQLYPGRDLVKQKMVIVPMLTFGPVYGVSLVAGADAGLIVSLQPVTISATVGFKNFYPLRGLKVPDFTAEAKLGSGLKLEAFVAPYLGVMIGAAGIGGGVKIQGKASLNVGVDVAAEGGLKGSGGKFSGWLGASAGIKASVTLSFQPVLFASAGPLGSAEYPIESLQAEYTFPDIFAFQWGKKYTFGDDGQQTEAQGAPAAADSGGSSSQEGQAKQAPESVPSGAGAGPSTDQDRPAIGEESAKGEQGGQASDMQQKINEIKEYAANLGKLAKLVGFVVDIVSISALLSFMGPLGILVAAVIALIKIGGPGGIIEGFEGLVWFIGKLAAWIWSLMPDWMQNLYAEIQRLVSMGADGAAREVATKIKSWAMGALGSWGPVFEPLIDWVAGSAKAFIQALGAWDGSPLALVKIILSLTMAAVGSITSLVPAIQGVLSNIVLLVRKLVADGKIVATCTDPDDTGKNPWYVYVDIPGLITLSMGPSDDTGPWAAGNLLAKALRDVFGCSPNTNVSSDYGFDHR